MGPYDRFILIHWLSRQLVAWGCIFVVNLSRNMLITLHLQRNSSFRRWLRCGFCFFIWGDGEEWGSHVGCIGLTWIIRLCCLPLDILYRCPWNLFLGILLSKEGIRDEMLYWLFLGMSFPSLNSGWFYSWSTSDCGGSLHDLMAILTLNRLLSDVYIDIEILVWTVFIGLADETLGISGDIGLVVKRWWVYAWGS